VPRRAVACPATTCDPECPRRGKDLTRSARVRPDIVLDGIVYEAKLSGAGGLWFGPSPDSRWSVPLSPRPSGDG
jgi:hypothetical protein